MPAMLNPELVKSWIINEIELEQLQKEMISQKDLKYYAVSKHVGNVKNNYPALLNEESK